MFGFILCVFSDNDSACAPMDWETIEICGFYLYWASIIPAMAASTCVNWSPITKRLCFSNRSAQFSFASNCFCHFKFINSLSNSYLILFVIPISVLPIHTYLSRLCACLCFAPLWSLMLCVFFQYCYVHFLFHIFLLGSIKCSLKVRLSSN